MKTSVICALACLSLIVEVAAREPLFEHQPVASPAAASPEPEPSAVQESRSPVERVVLLLKDLKAKTENDGKEELQMYDKYACWCEKTTKRKAASIDEAQMTLRALGQQILKLKGKIATLTSEIAELKESIRKNEEAQAEATAIRQKENEAYQAETAEMKQALAALEKAVTVLSDATKPAPALLQENAGSSAWHRASLSVRAAVAAIPAKADLSSQQMSLLSEFMQAGAKYAPQSGTVQGILKDMYDTFSADLESTTQAEASKNRLFEDFMATKQEELIKLKETKAKKEDEKAEAEGQLADATQAYDDTEAQMKADIAFFDETKAACTAKMQEWSERKALRAEEIEGIKKALSILTSDEAREMFASAIKPGIESFLQLESESMGSQAAAASRAFAALKASAAKAHSLRLASLAVAVRTAKTGHFDKVLVAIDAMVQTLKDEDADDIAKRDQCKEQYLDIESKVKDIKWKIEKNVAKIDKLEKLIELRTADKAKTIEDIQDVIENIAQIEEQRQDENRAFLQAKSDDESAIDLLKRAKAALAAYYSKNKIALGPIQGSVKGLGFAQQGPVFDVSEDQAPDATFSHKGKRKNESKGIVSIITMIIEDLQDEIKTGLEEEETAQLDFEKQLGAAKNLKAELEEKKVNLEEVIAKRSSQKDDEHADMQENQKDLDDELAWKKEISSDCDWILRAFEGRRERRQAEMEGLTTAKEYLAGAAVPEAAGFLQTPPSPRKFNDDKFLQIRFQGLAQ